MARDPSYRRVTRAVALRPLVDLMDDKVRYSESIIELLTNNLQEFYHRVHARFCWVMQSCKRRIASRMVNLLFINIQPNINMIQFRIPHIIDDAPTATHAGTAIPLGIIRSYVGYVYSRCHLL